MSSGQPRLRLGLLFGGVDLDIKQMIKVGQAAEAHGIDALYCVEAFRCGLLPLSALAAATEAITIGPYVLNAALRTPLAAGLAALDLDEMSQGRLELAVGAGNAHISRRWAGVEPEPPVAKMRDYIAILRMMMRAKRGEPVVHQGQVHSIDWVRQAASPNAHPVPVYMAASFPKMITVAATAANGLALGALVGPTYLREVILPAVRDALARTNRDPDAFGIKVCTMVAVDKDRATAHAKARNAVAGVFAAHPHPYYEHLLREQGFAQQLDRCLAAVDAGRMAEAADAIDDRVIDSLLVWGTPGECAAKLSAYECVADEAVLAHVASPATMPAVDRYRPLLDVVDKIRRSPVSGTTSDQLSSHLVRDQ